MARLLRVAAIQVRSENGGMQANLEHAEPFVVEAARSGAELVLCPEFLAAGYIYDESIWDCGEPTDGPTERWLSRLARECGVTIGATFLEAAGEHFYNTFSLFGPDGLLGRVRKASLPVFEGWYFTPCQRSKLIETPFGRVAVGICHDNQTAHFLREVASEQPDVILMPHSAPTPEALPLLGSLARFVEGRLCAMAPSYAAALGVPVVMANKVSASRLTSPIPLLPFVRLAWRFRGHSAICDGDGSTVASRVDVEGALVADVRIDPANKHRMGAAGAGPTSGYWSFNRGGAWSGAAAVLLQALEALGKRAYGRNRRRAIAATEAQARRTRV